MKRFLLASAFTLSILASKAQTTDSSLSNMIDVEKPYKEPVTATFKASRLINLHSNETVKKHELDFRIDHHFGDLAGTAGGYKTFWGLQSIADFRIGFEYGVTDKLTTSVGMVKGVGAQNTIWDFSVKYKLLQQTTDNHTPVGITLYSDAMVATNATALDSNSNPEASALNGYANNTERWNYCTQAIIVRKFNSNFSVAIIPTYIHRNRVVQGDKNDMLALGMGFRYKFTKRFGIVADYTLPFRNKSGTASGTTYYNPLGVGIEIETGGHVFHVNFTNSEAILEQQSIPTTTKSWTNGGVRWGFNVSRTFSIFH